MPRLTQEEIDEIKEEMRTLPNLLEETNILLREILIEMRRDYSVMTIKKRRGGGA